jgi:putative nucleotidyltransferase with HDIG domain
MPLQSTLVREPAALADQPELSVLGASREARLEAIVAEGLPTLPNYLFELSARLKSDPVDLKRVATLIAADPCLSAQVLRTCNTLPFAKPILCIENAVERAGIDRLRGMVLTVPLLQMPRGRGRGEIERLLLSYWQHSPWTALLSERLAQWTGYQDPDKAYLAGLLHDIGKVPLMLEGIFVEDGGEQGYHHVEIGRLLATAWNYPPELTEVLELHHRPRQALLDPALTGIVAMADQYGERCGLGLAVGEPRLSRPTAREAVELLHDCLPGISPDQATRVAESLENNLLSMLLVLGERLSFGCMPRKRP